MKKFVASVCLFISSYLGTAYANPEYATTTYLTPPDLLCSQCHSDGRTWSTFHNQYDLATNRVHLPVIYFDGTYFSADLVMVRSQPTMRFRVENLQQSQPLASISLASDYYHSAMAVYYEECTILEINNITVGTRNYRNRRLSLVAGSPDIEFEFAPVATVSTEAMAFGYQLINEASATQTVTVSNTGTAAMLISSICLDGADSNQFILSNTCGESLEAGEDCTVNVTFTPTVVGNMSATLTVRVAEPAMSKIVALSGTSTTMPILGAPSLVMYDDVNGMIHCSAIATADGVFSADLVMVQSLPSFRFQIKNLQENLAAGQAAAIFEEGGAQLLIPDIKVGTKNYMVTLGLVPDQPESEFELVEAR